MQPRRLWVFALAFAVLVSACGTAATEPAATATVAPPQPTETAETPATPEPVILRYGMTLEPDCMHSIYACTSLWIQADLIWEGFTGFGPNCQVEPRLAKSMEVSADGLTWTLHLQDNVTWTDGEPFDAYDVEAYWKWAMSVAIRDWYPPTRLTTSYKATDASTFEFTLAAPLGTWANYDSIWQWPLPPQVWANTDDTTMWEIPTEPIVTTGPFILKEWKRGSYMIFDANPNYYLGKPAVDRVVVQFYANEDAVVNALLAGEIDAIPSDLSAQYYDTLAADPKITVVEQPPGRQLSLFVNSAAKGKMNPAVKDLKVREAIDYAIDKQNIIDVVLLGKGILCPNGGINCGPLYAWHLDPSAQPTPYDPEKARQILEEAGYRDSDNDGVREGKDGQPLDLRLYYDVASSVSDGAARLISEQLAAVGIKTTTTAMESATLQNAGYVERDFDLAVRMWSGDADPAAGDFALSCWSAEPGTGLNFPGYCNPKYDEAVQKHVATMGLENRLPMIYEAQRIAAADRPQIMLAGMTSMGAFRNDRFTIPTDPCSQLGLLLGWYPTTHAEPAK